MQDTICRLTAGSTSPLTPSLVVPSFLLCPITSSRIAASESIGNRLLPSTRSPSSTTWACSRADRLSNATTWLLHTNTDVDETIFDADAEAGRRHRRRTRRKVRMREQHRRKGSVDIVMPLRTCESGEFRRTSGYLWQFYASTASSASLRPTTSILCTRSTASPPSPPWKHKTSGARSRFISPYATHQTKHPARDLPFRQPLQRRGGIG